MAKVKELTVDVTARMTVSDETACRCLRLLEMWMDDHPEAAIIVDRENTTLGWRHHARIDRGGDGNR